MFDFVRKHTKIMMALMFLLIIPSFVLFGVDGYRRFNEGGEVVVRVAGHDIKQGEWDLMHKNETDRLRATMPTADAKLLDSPQARYATLERMVRERVLTEAADKEHLAISDARLARALQEDPSIAALRRPDGTLDVERYRELAAMQGMTPAGFEARVRSSLSSRQVMDGVAGTGFVPKAVADLALNAFFDRREIQVVRFNAADYTAKVNPTDAEIEAYYKDHASAFFAPESANVEYVTLDLDAIKKSITLNEADLKTYYEQNLARLAGQEQRRASHILINAPKSASADERAKAKAKAEALLAEVKKAPATFADVAKKNSQDPGSAPNGGDLDFFAHGAMVKPFEDAAFSMKVGDISDVVESEFGYHIIKLTDIKSAPKRSLEEMRPELEADLKTQQAQRKYAETAEIFSNGVYEQSESLKPVADKLKLEIKTATGLSRDAAPGTKGVLANPKFLAALFASDATEKKRNTEAIEVGANQLASGRVTQYTPARTLPLAEVKDKVRAQLVAERAAALAKKDGEDKLTAWTAQPQSATLPAAITVARDQSENQPLAVVDAALLVDAAKLPAFTGVALPGQGYAVLRVNKRVPRPAQDEARAKQEREQFGQGFTAAEAQAYYAVLKERFKVQFKVPKPDPLKSGAEQQAANR